MTITKETSSKQTDSGFTLIEILVATIIIGILAAISAPSLVGILERQRLASANSEIYQAVRQAQNKAKQEKVTWQTSFREQGDVVQWAIHRANATPTNWNSLDSNIEINTGQTTFHFYSSIWRVRFNYKGNISGQLGKIILNPKQNSQVKSCVITSTLLGAVRTGKGAECD